MHDGLLERARALARRNLEAFPADVDAIVTTAAGCGSGVAEYPELFAGSAEAELAKRHAAAAVDVHVFLDRREVKVRWKPGSLCARGPKW
jgi:glycolate oxidase iron-sulfur subunit